MKKQPDITEATRNAFIEVFCRLYRERPIERITVKELAERAGYNRSTFYEYFRDVYDLQTQVEDELIAFILEGIAAYLRDDQMMENFVLVFISRLEEKQALAETFLANPHDQHLPNRLRAELAPIVLRLFRADAGDMRAQYAMEFYIPGILAVIGRWLRSKQDMPLAELAALVQGILQEGVLAQIRAK